MIMVISPAKKQDFKQAQQLNYKLSYTLPNQLQCSQILIDILKQKSKEALIKLMSISPTLAQLNQKRYQTFTRPFTPDNAKQALLAFKGDVYQGIDVEHYQDEDFAFAQRSLRILSGLYGILRPLDLIQAYRLEMATKLANPYGENLYQFWGETLSHALNDIEDKVVINLASNAYFKSIKAKALNAKILQIDFKENRNGVYKIIGIYAKKARGLMVNYAIKNRIRHSADLQKFNTANYQFNTQLSNDWHWIFTR